MIRRLAIWFGPSRVRYVVFAIVAVSMLVAAMLIVETLQDRNSGWAPADVHGIEVSDQDDEDADGLADAIENRIGSRINKTDSLGRNVPDGWVYHWYGSSVDWEDHSFLDQPALVPPPGAWPEILQQAPPQLPTISAVYLLDLEVMHSDAETGWWHNGTAIDPTNWDNDGDGLADAWLVNFGLHPLRTSLNDPAPGDPSMTLREKYEAGLDPTTRDSDGDGLFDLEEISGFASFGSIQRSYESTDPRAFSTRQDAIPDGYLVRFGLDPHDAGIAPTDPANDGLSVMEAYRLTEEHCRTGGDGACDWRERLQTGPLVDPTAWDSLGDGTPDAWDARDPNGIAHPLIDARTIRPYSTDAWDAQAGGESTTATGLIVDELNPAPERLELSLVDLYRFLRPSAWNEAADGPWWEGLPTDIQSPEGSLPPAVALRGWTIELDSCLGCNATRPSTDANRHELHVWSDPRKSDSDDDGIPDVDEYLGRDAAGNPTARTNPGDADSDRDGLSDYMETTEVGTNPLHVDTSGSYLSDGEEWDYWTERHRLALNAFTQSPDIARQTYAWLAPGRVPTLDDVEQLGPLGHLNGDQANILSSDSDGDGIADGAELYPNRFLGRPTIHERPATDPARTDTDGDGLPDVWEIRWSQEQYYGCSFPCTSSQDIHGWPTDPSCWDSLDPSTCGQSYESESGVKNDAQHNLAGDEVAVAPHAVPVQFTNEIAYLYDLHPFRNDTNGDGIRDMFAVHWGVENVPEWVQESVAQREELAWTGPLTESVSGVLLRHGVVDAPDTVVIHPNPGSQQPVGKESNLLGMFSDRRKGTWIVDMDDPACPVENQTLPDSTDATRASMSEVYNTGGIPSRDGLRGPCWKWFDYPVGHDQARGTNPWTHDFDEDGLPDAWEAWYSPDRDVVAAKATDASLATGCRDENRTSGLPTPSTGDFCLSYLESYAKGVDPRTIEGGEMGDTDGGGLVDWIEVALGLDPLDPMDDHGNEDWDGDGLLNWVEDELGTNRLSPDTDRDGLLDGDPDALRDVPYFDARNGAGNLCLRHGGDNVTADEDGLGGMKHRPWQDGLGAGNITHTERYDWYVAMGILFDNDPGDTCPAPAEIDGEQQPYTLFLREVAAKDSGFHVDIRGAGQGSDSRQWDTSGDGIPDGWMVYWRTVAAEANDNAVQASLDPNARSGDTNADQDNLLTFEEYEAGRPADWIERRDGPWWGGTNPVSLDTDGDAGWFASEISGWDGTDEDTDSDGIPTLIDPFPGIDATNAGIVAWNETRGAYESDYPAVWRNLHARATYHALDADGDLVPDFLDRAQVRVDDVTITRDGTSVQDVTKGTADARFTVTGRLMVHETSSGASYESQPFASPHTEAPAGVINATVKAYLTRGGATALVGVGFTGPQGHFALDAGIGAATPSVEVPIHMAAVEGTVYAGGAQISLPSTASMLEPGNGILTVVVEPNAPELQPVEFQAEQGIKAGAVIAYKDVGGSQGMRLPDSRGEPGPALRAARMGTSANGEAAPDAQARHVRHTAEAVMAGRSAELPLTIKATTHLTGVAPTPLNIVKRPLYITGTFVDAVGVGLPERNVTIGLYQEAMQVAENETETAASGSYEAWLDTTNLEPGVYTVKVAGSLRQTDKFLDPPPPLSFAATLAQQTKWSAPLQINEQPRLPGQKVEMDVDDTLWLNATLIDVESDDVVPLRDVKVRLVRASTGTSVLPAAQEASTDEQGILSTKLSLPSTPINPEFLRLEFEAEAITEQDVPALGEIFIQPRFPTSLTVTSATAQVGSAAVLEGTLTRTGPGEPQPVPFPPGSIQVKGPDGNVTTISSPVSDDGTFEWTVPSSIPMRTEWSLRFVADPDEPFLRSTEWVEANSTHVATTSVHLDPALGIVDQPLQVTGRVVHSGNQPVAGAAVHANWQGSDAISANRTNATGAFVMLLPPRTAPGDHVAQFEIQGNDTLLPSSSEETFRWKLAPRANATADPMILQPDGTGQGNYRVTLMDPTGQPMSARSMDIRFTAPDGTVLHHDGITDASGSIRVTASEVKPTVPGLWNATAYFDGDALHAAATVETEFPVHHEIRIHVDRLPAIVATDSAWIRGHLEGVAQSYEPMPIEARTSGRGIADAMSTPDRLWNLLIHTSDLPGGRVDLQIHATTPQFVHAQPINASLFVSQEVGLRIEERIYGNGERQLDFYASAPSTDLQDGLQVKVVRKHPQTGEILGTHDVTLDSQARGSLALGPGDHGDLKIVALSDPALDLGHVEFSTAEIQVDPVESGVPSWLLPIVLVLGSVGLAISYRLWRRRHRTMLGSALRDARTSLLDPSASPVEVIRNVYEAVLRIMSNAGYRPSDVATVRDIQRQLTRTFALPDRPTSVVSDLFEVAIYSDLGLDEGHRRRALDAFGELIRHLRSRRDERAAGDDFRPGGSDA